MPNQVYMEKIKPMNTPMATNIILEEDKSGKSVNATLYRGMIGSLLYLTACRPNISSLCVYVLDFKLILKNLILLLSNV